MFSHDHNFIFLRSQHNTCADLNFLTRKKVLFPPSLWSGTNHLINICQILFCHNAEVVTYKLPGFKICHIFKVTRLQSTTIKIRIPTWESENDYGVLSCTARCRDIPVWVSPDQRRNQTHLSMAFIGYYLILPGFYYLKQLLNQFLEKNIFMLNHNETRQKSIAMHGDKW